MIEVRDITKSYDGLAVLKGVSLEVPQGKVLGIVGPSGAGKTTLLHIMGTLDAPDSGVVKYDNQVVTSLNDARLSAFRNRNIGFVFQFHRLLPEFTLEENVMLPALIAGTPMATARAEATKLIGRLGLSARTGHKPSELSGGERQRAAVARALINSPRVVLADEPTGSLDSHNRAELHRLFFDLRDELGQTFVIVTHDDHLAADCDTTIRMADGKIV